MTLLHHRILSRSVPRPRCDRILVWILSAIAIIVGAISVLIFSYLLLESVPALRQTSFVRFFTDASWSPTEDLYNLSPMIAGSLLAMILAMLLATPLGVLSAIFIHFYAHRRVTAPYRRSLEILAGIPSVVYGFWGLVVLVPLINQFEPPGASLLAASLVLAIMILPTIALSADAALINVPPNYIRGAYALGLNRLGVLKTAVLPAARSGLITGVILQAGRAIGETMAVLMVCGNIVQLPASIFEPVRTLTANIALEMAYAVGTHRSALFASGLILMLVVTTLVILADFSRTRAQ